MGLKSGSCIHAVGVGVRVHYSVFYSTFGISLRPPWPGNKTLGSLQRASPALSWALDPTSTVSPSLRRLHTDAPGPGDCASVHTLSPTQPATIHLKNTKCMMQRKIGVAMCSSYPKPSARTETTSPYRTASMLP